MFADRVRAHRTTSDSIMERMGPGAPPFNPKPLEDRSGHLPTIRDTVMIAASERSNVGTRRGRKWPGRINDLVGEVVFVETMGGEKFCGRLDDYEFGVLLLWDTTGFDHYSREWIHVEDVGSETGLIELHYRSVKRLAVREGGEPKLFYEGKGLGRGRKGFLATMAI